MAEFHFVEDYVAHVKSLKTKYSLDEAMSLAVGGSYEKIGRIAAEILIQNGLADDMTVLDFGCGSGRVAHALAQRTKLRAFLGIDVVQDLLDYAETKTPKHYTYKQNHKLSIPAKNEVFDYAYAFSVFTHLLHEETFAYMEDIHRTLKTGGIFLFSFLEFASPAHWAVFSQTVASRKQGTSGPLNTFLDRNQIAVLAQHAKFEVASFFDGHDTRWSGEMLGQAICVLRKVER